MSGGLMSCVRENSPPLDMDMNASGPLSLPEPRINTSDLIDSVVHSSSQQNIMSLTPLAAHANAHLEGDGGPGGAGGGSTPLATPPNTEQQKRRRFHPLRNLRRIFRRRTITADTTAAASAAATADTPQATLTVPAPTSSASEKNLRSATLSSITSVASASSPSSPLTHQQLHDAYLTQSLPKTKSSYLSLLGGGGKNKSHDSSLSNEGKTKTKHKHKNQKHQQQLHQQQHQLQSKELELHEDDTMFGTTTQTSASYHHQQHHVQQHHAMATSTTTSSATKSSLLSQRQSIGVAVFPGAMNRNFFAERQKLRSVGDSSQDLDSGSGNDSGTGGGHVSSAAKNSSNSGGEMSDSQRSLSEGRLIDSDYSRDGLSQSHDSVFSESATASSLSIVLKAELADVLRKRRNRPDASDEDLGLPRSPASPQRRALANKTTSGPLSLQTKSVTADSTSKQSEMSSLSLLSMNSIDGEDMLASSTANNSMATESVKERSRYSRSSTLSSISMTSADILRHRDSSSVSFDSKDEVDLFSNDWQRLSHSAAKHKMAIRPNKKKGGPSRQHRRTLETSIPEANEDLSKLSHKKLLDMKDLDAKTKTRSLPPGVNAAKLMEDHQLNTNVIAKNTPPPNAFKDTNNKIMTTLTPATPAKATTKFSATSSTAVNQTMSSTSSTAAAPSSSSSSASLSATPAAATPAAATSATSNSIFGFRSLTTKASAIFEPKETPDEIAQKSEVLKKPETMIATEPIVESNDTGFLRRLIQRNSKRSIAKVNAGDMEELDGLDVNRSEPKKLHVASVDTKSFSNASSITQDVTKSEFSYISSKNENHSEMKRDFLNDNRSYMAPSTPTNATKEFVRQEDLSVPSKPKSGPAARQRYMPQNISNENLHQATEELMSTNSKESILSKSSNSEGFKSTSMIQEITKQQTSSAAVTAIISPTTKPEHHFEKKPKIVGLSAFQQKISRSNDSFARANSSSTNTSMVSLDQGGGSELELCAPVRAQIYEQKARKSVEKSKSFRAYGEEKTPPPMVHNNMPSLPDLSLNLRAPYYKDFVVHEREQTAKDRTDKNSGFEFNEDKERKSFSNYDLNATVSKTSPLTPTKPLLAQKVMLSPLGGSANLNSPLSPYNRNFAELESSVESNTRSPFISVIRKSSNFSEISNERLETTTTNKTNAVLSSVTHEKVRPALLPLLKMEKSLSEDNVLNSPSTANVTLREKSLNKQNLLFTNSSGCLEPTKDLERKSAPQPTFSTNAKGNSNGIRANSTRRSSSVTESVEAGGQAAKVPEFMKIQLNRVDPMRLSHSHVVLAKNIKESPAINIAATHSRESSPEKEDDFRRLSSESVDIHERYSPEMEKRFPLLYHEAVNKQPKLCIGLPPKSPIKKSLGPTAAQLPTTPTTPPTPTINERDGRQESETHFKLPEPQKENTNNSSLSLQERRRLFMSEDKNKAEKRMEDMKYERKKSINEELVRKTVMKSESLEQRETSPTENGVILRKKSFASSSSHLSMNGNALNNNNIATTTCASPSSTGSDPTPELMKVFARRSLKVKDEDLDRIMAAACNTNISSNISNNNNNNTILSPCTVSAPQTLNKFTTLSNSSSISSSSSSSSNPNVDSDKENHSASEEKLDKLTKLDSDQCITITKASAVQTLASNGCGSVNVGGQRNSLADFRHIPVKANSPGLSVNNNSNTITNNNNNNSNNSPLNGNVTVNKSFLPPIKSTGFRPVSMERNNNLNNTLISSSSPAKSTTLERPSSIKIMGDLMAPPPPVKTENSTKKTTTTMMATTAITTATTTTTNITKTFERSATVSEFKGIHQRRAEWEQRAKEALK